MPVFYFWVGKQGDQYLEQFTVVIFTCDFLLYLGG
ncbi:hypothetical protein PAMA110636_02530 [Paenibacillus macerans]